MRQPYLVAGVLLVGLCLGASAVNAQEEPARLPGSALGATGALSDKDQKLVIQWIEYWMKELTSGDAERIAIARGKLVEPYNQGGGEPFTSFYDQTLAGRIGDGLAAKDVPGRVNTMIVARAIRHAKAADVIKGGLKDEITAVRYQAAAAAEAYTSGKQVEMAAKLGMRGALTDALKKEESGFVLENLYLSLCNIPDFAGWDAVLSKMEERLAVHVAKPTTGIDAEASGLRALQVVIITAKSASATGGVAVPGKLINHLLLTCTRYLNWAVMQPAPHSTALQAFIATCESGARWAVPNSGAAGVKLPGVVASATDDEQKLYMMDWTKLLKAEPFKFKDEEISLPKPPAK